MAENKPVRGNYLYYTSSNRQTNFGKLPGHYQGAILDEANIQLRAYQLSSTYKDIANNPENEKKILAYFCEKYASDEKKYKELAIRSSKELYRYPLAKDRDEYRERCSKSIARKIDKHAELGKSNPNTLDMIISKSYQR